MQTSIFLDAIKVIKSNAYLVKIKYSLTPVPSVTDCDEHWTLLYLYTQVLTQTRLMAFIDAY